MRWSDGNAENPRQVTITQDTILQAIFRESRKMHSEGTDFWVTFLQGDQSSSTYGGTLSLTFAALEPCNITIENPANGMKQFIAMPAGVTRNLELYSGSLATDYAGSWNCYSRRTGEVLHTGLHITSDNNISLFAANHRTKTFDVTNVLPKSDLQDEYFIQTYPASDHENKPQGTHFAIVATEDSTVVDYMVTTAVKMGDSIVPAGSYLTTPVLNAGEVWYVWTGKNDGYKSDLSGSYVKARDGKPIAVFQGDPHTNIPYMVRDRDHIFSQAMPVASWGNEFVVPSSLHHKRDIIRVMALEDGTQVFVNGQLAHTFDFVNGDENDQKRTFEFELGESNVYGDLGDKTYGYLSEPLAVGNSCYITTSAPSSVHLFMTSNRYDNYQNRDAINDPAMLYISPLEQMVKEACFSTYNTVPLHYINIIAATNAIEDIALKGADTLMYLAQEFQAVNGNSEYSFARTPIDPGVYTLSGSSGFIAYVYGFGEKESYAFSVGGKSIYSLPKMHLFLGCDSTMGYTIGSGEYDYNEIVTIEAHAYQDFEFVHWSDGDIDSVRQVLLTGDKELFALFKEKDSTPTDTVEVKPTDNSAEIHWPEVPNAYSYCITIWLDIFHTQIFCKIYFNAYGMIIGIVFEYNSNYANRAPQKLAESNVEFDFSLYGLDPETTYYFTVTAYDEEGNELDQVDGEFTTLNELPTSTNSILNDSYNAKILRDGQILILRGEKIYTAQGVEIQ